MSAHIDSTPFEQIVNKTIRNMPVIPNDTEDLWLHEYSKRLVAALGAQEPRAYLYKYLNAFNDTVWTTDPRWDNKIPLETSPLYAAPIPATCPACTLDDTAELDALIADAERLNYVKQKFHVLGFTHGTEEWFCLYIGDTRRADNLRDMIDLMKKPNGI